MLNRFLVFAAGLAVAVAASAGVVKVGSGSYSDAFPGYDAAGRNGYIKTEPQVSGKAAGRPIPTNDWWSNELVSSHGNSIFNYPLCIRNQDTGMAIIKNMQQQATMQGPGALDISIEGLSEGTTTVCDYSDWTVTFSWGGQLEATVAQCSPFVYFTLATDQGTVNVQASGQFKTLEDNILLVTGSYNQADYAVYAPSGSTWEISGTTAKCNLAGKDYFSALLLPSGSDAETTAREWSRYAYVFPSDTRAEFVYTPATGEVTTTYRVTPDVKEGSEATFLMGLLPHHWANLQVEVAFTGESYSTVRGELKMAGINEFTTSLKFHGILPTLPAVTSTANGFSQSKLDELVETVINDHGLVDWTDSYNDGQLLNRLVQVGRIAKESGNTVLFQQALDLVKERVERWMQYDEGDIDFMYYYHAPWTTLLGYPAGHGQDTNINDHHFHWGYMIHAAAFIEENVPGWKDQWGGMVDLLIRDAASTDRNDEMFPYMRNFSPYSGHSWANGTASLGLGNDQESTSESMQFSCALIHWGEVTGQTEIRDLGVYLYATELSAAEEYWFDIHDRNLDPSYTSAVVSRVFTNGYDNENFWGGGIAGSYGIEIYPLHAGSFYLVHDQEFAKKYWNAMTTETGILSNEANDNIWYDAWNRFYAMIDPAEALKFYNNCTRLGGKFGDSQAHTYQWVHSLAVLGTPMQDVTASSPLAAVFYNNGVRTYVAQNYGADEQTVTFSDGYSFTVPAHTLYSEVDGEPLPEPPAAEISATPEKCKPGEEVVFTVTVAENDYTVNSVEVKVNGSSIGTCADEGSNTYSISWTAGEKAVYTITSEIATAEGVTFEKGELRYTVTGEDGTEPDDPVTPPGVTTEQTFTFTADDAVEGAFNGGGFLRFIYDGVNVKVIAHFDGEYVGFAGPWLFNYTDGFAEIAMSPDGEDYSCTLTGYAVGTTVKAAAKIAYVGGGLGVTPTYEFVLTEPSGIKSVAAEKGLFKVYPNPASEYISVEGTGKLTLWSVTGSKVLSQQAQGRGYVNLSTLPAGLYILTLETADGLTLNQRIIKR